MNRQNPWKGLDSYKESEKLYGRDDEVEVLMSRIEYNVQTVVYGRSGIGKSSILNAGIFPKARLAGMMPVAIRLLHTSDKENPTEPYIDQIRKAIDNELLRLGGNARELVPHAEGHAETLWEYLHRHTFSIENRPVRPLLVFDQFEEIFTLEKDHHRVTDFFAELADLLNGITPEYLQERTSSSSAETSTAPAGGANIFAGIKRRQAARQAAYLETDEFRIIFSLREDYLSYLERNTLHIPSLKMNRYCLQPINEEQAATIIMDPVPGLVSEEVAILIIEKITGETGFHLDGRPNIFVDSAILSLYLSRLYAMLPEGATAITADMVQRFGDNIIQDFYLEVIENVRPQTVEYLEDNLLNNEGRRENISVYNATHLGNVNEKELHYLCDEKRLLRRFFYGGDMRIEYIHDILCPVIKDRRDIRQMLRAQEAELQRMQQEEQRKREELERKARAQRKRYATWLIGGGLLLLFLIGHWFYGYYMDEMDCMAYYRSFTQVNGWPVGVGEKLSPSEVQHLAVSYRLSKKGHRSSRPFDMVEVMSNDEGLLHNNMRTPLVDLSEVSDRHAHDFAQLLNTTKYYKYSSTQGNSDDVRVTKYEALDSKGKVLYIVTYFNAIELRDNADVAVEAPFLWAVYTDANGAPLKMRDNGVDRMQVFLGPNGEEEKYMFFDENGAPKTNDLDCYGYRLHYDNLHRTDSVWGLDPFSEDEFIEVRNYTDSTTDYRYFDCQGTPINHKKLGYHRRKAVFDARGNTIHKEFYDCSGSHVNDQLRSSLVDLKYDDKNRLISTNDFDGDGRPYTQNRKYYPHREFTYIGNTMERLSTKCFRWDPDASAMIEVLTNQTMLYGSVVEYVTIDYEKDTYRMMRVEHNEEEEPVSVSYYGRNDKPAFDTIDHFSKHIIERNPQANGNTIVVHRFYDSDGSLYSKVGERNYAIDSCLYSPQGMLLSRVCYDRDTIIVLSQGYEYKDGIEVARYARGIHGNPIRCPRWERDGLSYYRLQNVRSLSDALSYVRPVNEYGRTSWAYVGTDPFGEEEHRGQRHTTDDMGSNWKRETVTTVYADHIPANAHSMVYVHLTCYGSLAEQYGLRDGDLLIDAGTWHYDRQPHAQQALPTWNSIGRQNVSLRVARYDQRTRSWQLLQFTIPASGNRDKEWGCEIYDIYYTDEEYQEFQKGIQHDKE